MYHEKATCGIAGPDHDADLCATQCAGGVGRHAGKKDHGGTDHTAGRGTGAGHCGRPVYAADAGVCSAAGTVW